jgi:hypothetical protein
MFAKAAKVTSPLAIVQVPWLATLKLPNEMQLLVFAGSTIQLEERFADP